MAFIAIQVLVKMVEFAKKDLKNIFANVEDSLELIVLSTSTNVFDKILVITEVKFAVESKRILALGGPRPLTRV